MTTKKTQTQEALHEEFKSSFGVAASVADPIETGDTHAGRGADQSTAPDPHPEAYSGQPGSEQPTTRTEILAHLFDNLNSLETPRLEGLYGEFSKLGGFGGDPHAGRAADQSTKSSGPSSYAGLKEDIQLVLKNTNLNEETLNKAADLFEAAVKNKVIEISNTLRQEIEEEVAAEMATRLEELEELNSKYMDYVAEEWTKQNEVALKSNIRVELAESFLNGFQQLCRDHYIDIPEDKVDVVERLAEEVEALQEQLDEAQSKLIEQEEVKTQETETREEILDELAESSNLSEAQKDHLKILCEGISLEDEDLFKDTVKSIVETFVAPTNRGNVDLLEEEVILEGGDVVDEDVDPTIGRLVKDMGRFAK